MITDNSLLYVLPAIFHMYELGVYMYMFMCIYAADPPNTTLMLICWETL